MAHRVRDWFRARGIDAFAARCIAVGMILVIVACT